MRKTARLIVTYRCHRGCSYCCNKRSKREARKINALYELAPYDTICLTGGEPLLEALKTSKIAEECSKAGKSVYLYTSIWSPLYDHLILPYISGISYTIHDDVRREDLRNLMDLQRGLKGKSEVSARLRIGPNVKPMIPVIPSLFSRIISQPWDEACEAPEDDLLSLETL